MIVGDFDIDGSFRFPFEADSKLVIDPNAELAFAAASQRFQSVAAQCSQVFQGSSGVEPDQASSSLFFDVNQFNDAPAAHQPLGPLVLERLDQYLYGITLQVILQGP